MHPGAPVQVHDCRSYPNHRGVHPTWLPNSLLQLDTGLEFLACLAHIERHGDHLLGCGQGLLRICQHDSVVNLLYHTISQYNYVWLEERILGPPDRGQGIYTYHPDFSNRHSAYFDVLVRNKLKIGNPNRPSTDAVASAITGEFEKDSKHAGSVEEVGGRFFPLVTKMVEVWTSSSFLLLCTFAERTTLHNGLSPSVTAHNLMQQISVKLWSYNTKMILQSPADNGPSFKRMCVISLINIVLLLLFLNLFVYCRVSLLSLYCY